VRAPKKKKGEGEIARPKEELMPRTFPKIVSSGPEKRRRHEEKRKRGVYILKKKTRIMSEPKRKGDLSTKRRKKGARKGQ